MPATPLRSHAFAPAPSSSDLGIMPDLYRLSVGPVNAAYYQKHFQRFETLGKPVASWNNGAAFFTLAWLLLRKLWRPAAIYAGVLAALLLVWWFGIHGRVPLPVEAAICLLGGLLLCVLPGFLGNALYYTHVRNQTLNTLGKASSLAQARVILSNDAPTKERLQVTAAVQGLVALGIAALVFSNVNLRPSRPAAPVPSGPPNIVIPSVESLRNPELQPVTPTVPLPAEQPEPAAPAATSGDAAPAETPVPQPATVPAAPSQAEQPEATSPSSKSPDDDLSIVQFAKAVPAAGAAAQAALASADAPATMVKTLAAAPEAAPKPAASAAAPTPAPEAKKPVAAPAAKDKEVPAKKAVAQPKSTAKTPERVDNNRMVPGKFYLNAGVYAQTANVNNAVKRLQALKLNTVRQTVQSNRGELTRLRIGPFDTRKQAEQAALKAKQLRIDTSIFQQPKT